MHPLVTQIRQHADMIHESLRPASSFDASSQVRDVLQSMNAALYKIVAVLDFLEKENPTP